ncbi:CpaF family protein [Naumannella sp. ID2617S]|uniref:Secretion protein n=1 Tax=Enemella dayhoffiae TaxID=2016507 RepID=A0A255GLF0_9ACTN|nr:CpaF/VirB11 family protein [Enemella dayhoffiae]NNG20475.1 CpaF family protein [Naumannella sp. ID2617S]OYO16655.1 secretion protein [Enemella dayhoffiae]
MTGEGVRLAGVELFQAPVGEPLTAPGLITGVPNFRREQIAAAPRAQAAAESRELDWGLVVALRRAAGTRISETEQYQAREGRPLSDADRRQLSLATIRRVVHEKAEQLQAEGAAMWPHALEERYAAAVESAMFGYGRMQPLFEIADAENIEIHGHDSVMVQYADGTRRAHPKVADSDDELVEAVRFLGEQANPSRPFDDAHPTMTLALGERFRLHAIGFGLAYRPSITIRQHTLVDVTLPDLVRTGMLPEILARYLHAAIQDRRSIVISGDQGAGKTTLLRALIAAIPDTERFGTIETDYELLTHLQPNRSNMVALQARIGLGERQDGRALGEFTVADLLPEALRQNLTRIVVGEVRGVEAATMFEAMSAGAGTLSTTHSHSAAATMDRLAMRIAQGGSLSLTEAYRQIAHNIDFLVHVTLVDDTWRGGRRQRFVSEVRQLTGAMEGDRPTTHLVHTGSGPDDPRGSFSPDPETSRQLARYAAAWPESR